MKKICPACGGIGEKRVLWIILRCRTCHGRRYVEIENAAQQITPADSDPRPGTWDYWASVTSKNAADDESR